MSRQKSRTFVRKTEYELTSTHIRLNLLRTSPLLHAHNIYEGTMQSTLSYPAYLGTF